MRLEVAEHSESFISDEEACALLNKTADLFSRSGEFSVTIRSGLAHMALAKPELAKKKPQTKKGGNK